MPNLPPGTTWQEAYEAFKELTHSANEHVAEEAERQIRELEGIGGADPTMKLEAEVLALFRIRYSDLLRFAQS